MDLKKRLKNYYSKSSRRHPMLTKEQLELLTEMYNCAYLAMKKLYNSENNLMWETYASLHERLRDSFEKGEMCEEHLGLWKTMNRIIPYCKQVATSNPKYCDGTGVAAAILKMIYEVSDNDR